MTDARIAGAAIAIGGLGVLVGGISGLLAMTMPAVIGVAVSLLILGVGVALAQRWSIVASRVVLWVVLIGSAFMTIPDREDAVRFGDPGLQWQFAAVAAYMLVCIVLVGRAARSKNSRSAG
jgi:hypothetical protein